MKKDQVVILEKRGTVLISGNDADNFLQNIITNDIKKVSNENSIFAALLTPQGKYLNDFFIVKNLVKTKYFRQCLLKAIQLFQFCRFGYFVVFL